MTYQHQIKILTLEGSIKAHTEMSLHASLGTNAGKSTQSTIIKHKKWRWMQMKALTMVGMLLHLLEGGISVRRSGLRLMLTAGGLFSCMFLDTPPGDSSPGEMQWLLKLPFPKERQRCRFKCSCHFVSQWFTTNDYRKNSLCVFVCFWSIYFVVIWGYIVIDSVICFRIYLWINLTVLISHFMISVTFLQAHIKHTTIYICFTSCSHWRAHCYCHIIQGYAHLHFVFPTTVLHSALVLNFHFMF